MWGWRRRTRADREATETRAEGSQAPPVVVRQPHALGAQLRLQDAILLSQVRDGFLLCCSCWSRPATKVTSKCSGTTRRVYVNPPDRVVGHYEVGRISSRALEIAEVQVVGIERRISRLEEVSTELDGPHRLVARRPVIRQIHMNLGQPFLVQALGP